jgi:hypothetical protein
MKRRRQPGSQHVCLFVCISSNYTVCVFSVFSHTCTTTNQPTSRQLIFLFSTVFISHRKTQLICNFMSLN